LCGGAKLFALLRTILGGTLPFDSPVNWGKSKEKPASPFPPWSVGPGCGEAGVIEIYAIIGGRTRPIPFPYLTEVRGGVLIPPPEAGRGGFHLGGPDYGPPKLKPGGGNGEGPSPNILGNLGFVGVLRGRVPRPS
jgi:hypothetical protein